MFPHQQEQYRETCDIHSASDEYASRFVGSTGEWLLSVQEEILLKLVGKEHLTILDVGGGHGQTAIPLVCNGHHATVLGSEENALHRVLVNSKQEHLTIQTATGSLLEIPFPDKSFDVVICFRIVSHTPHWEQLLKELCRVSNHSVIIDYPTYKSVNVLSKFLFSAKKKIEGNTRTFTTFYDREITSVIEKAGFKVEAQIGQFFFPMALHRMLKKPRISQMLEGLAGVFGIRKSFGSPIILKATRLP